jgi:hypothetical protein
MSKIVIDPVTRIEGHLRIEVEVDGGQVTDAWASSTMFRGIELILKGHVPGHRTDLERARPARGVDFHAAHMRGLNDGSRRLLRASS